MQAKQQDRRTEVIVRFIAETVQLAGANGVVVGLSGGLDSALVTRLAVQALGPGKVHTIYMPSRSSPADDERATTSLSRLWGTIHQTIPIDSMVSAATATMNAWDDRLAVGNIMARSRMMVLYHLARKRGLLVLGTGNRSEIMMGYFTKHGDGACDALPIGRLFKTEVRAISRNLGIPDEFLSRPPSAGLWEGQTDESELGVAYTVLDGILMAYCDGMSTNDIAKSTGSSKSIVESIVKRVESNRHKSEMPLLPPLD